MISTSLDSHAPHQRPRWWARWFAPVDIASLVAFRIAFGALMLGESLLYLRSGWVRQGWIEPEFHFTFYGFGWIHPWPGDGMLWHWRGLAVLAAFIMLGCGYRLIMTLFFLGFLYVFLIDATNYLNHFYLIILFSFLMIFVPAHRAFSMDAWLRPATRSQTTPSWALWVLRFQMGIAFFYGGVAKINADWLRGEPMRQWLAQRGDFPLLGRFFNEEWAVYLFAYGGLFFDLLAVPLLLWQRTSFIRRKPTSLRSFSSQRRSMRDFKLMGIVITLTV